MHKAFRMSGKGEIQSKLAGNQHPWGMHEVDNGGVSNLLFRQMLETSGIQLITKHKSNMKNKLMNFADKVLLRQRSIAETIIDQLKNISQIEHSRHRSPMNFLVNLLCGLIAYCHQPKKPSRHLHERIAITA